MHVHERIMFPEIHELEHALREASSFQHALEHGRVGFWSASGDYHAVEFLLLDCLLDGQGTRFGTIGKVRLGMLNSFEAFREVRHGRTIDNASDVDTSVANEYSNVTVVFVFFTHVVHLGWVPMSIQA